MWTYHEKYCITFPIGCSLRELLTYHDKYCISLSMGRSPREFLTDHDLRSRTAPSGSSSLTMRNISLPIGCSLREPLTYHEKYCISLPIGCSLRELLIANIYIFLCYCTLKITGTTITRLRELSLNNCLFI